MKTPLLILTCCLLSTLAQAAEPSLYVVVPVAGKTNAFTTITGAEFGTLKNARIVKADALEVRVMHDDGVTTLQTARFPEPMRSALGAGDAAAVKKAQDEKEERERLSRMDAAARLRSIEEANARAAGRAPQPAAGAAAEPQTIRMPQETAAAIQQRAEKEWPGDFRMQKYEVEKQSAAWLKIAITEHEGILGVPDEVLKDILQKAREEWRQDFRMVIYEVQKQARAYRELHP